MIDLRSAAAPQAVLAEIPRVLRPGAAWTLARLLPESDFMRGGYQAVATLVA
jgi:hypothetical protein